MLLLPQEAAHVGRLTLVVAARDEQGRTSPFQRIELPVSVPNTQIQEALSGAAGYPMQLEMKAGRQRVSASGIIWREWSPRSTSTSKWPPVARPLGTKTR